MPIAQIDETAINGCANARRQPNVLVFAPAASMCFLSPDVNFSATHRADILSSIFSPFMFYVIPGNCLAPGGRYRRLPRYNAGPLNHREATLARVVVVSTSALIPVTDFDAAFRYLRCR